MGRENVQSFLKKLGILASDIDIKAEIELFHESMQKGLHGVQEKDALRMIPTYISLGKNVPLHQKVIVIDAGGTHFRICHVQFAEDGKVVIENFKSLAMPGSTGEISKEEFYFEIAKVLLPYLDQSKILGFSFSYASEILPNGDGRILRFSKEVQIPEAEGTLLGEGVREHLALLGYTGPLALCVLNDTVAALLAGFQASNKREFSSYAGFILGTGINSAYTEDNINISKLRGKVPLLNNMIINMESGDYYLDNLSIIDKLVDAESVNPGEHLLEKQCSGRYQGRICYFILDEAVKQSNLFSSYFIEGFSNISTLDSKDLDQFIEDPYGNSLLAKLTVSDEDKKNMFYIVDNIFERVAIRVSIILAAIHKQCKKGFTPVKPLAITMEGTTYQKSKMFRSKLNYYVKKIINDEMHYYNTFMHVEDANLIGSAIAALMHCI